MHKTDEVVLNINLKRHSKIAGQCRWLSSWIAGLQTVCISLLTKLNQTQWFLFSKFYNFHTSKQIIFSLLHVHQWPLTNNTKAHWSWATGQCWFWLLRTTSVPEHASYQVLFTMLHFAHTNSATQVPCQ